jgi:hypothetical protein
VGSGARELLGCGLDRPGFAVHCRLKQEYFCTAKCPDQLWRLFLQNWGLSPRVRWPWCEAHHSPLSSAEVTNEWSRTSTPPHTFMECTFATLLFLGRSNLLGDGMLHCSRGHCCFVFGRSLAQSRPVSRFLDGGISWLSSVSPQIPE